MTLDFNRPAPKKTQTYDSLEEMLVELGIKEDFRTPNQLGKAELHTSFSTSGDPKNLTWYNNRDTKVKAIIHLYGEDEIDRVLDTFDSDYFLAIVHPHTFNVPCGPKLNCRLYEETPAGSLNSDRLHE